MPTALGAESRRLFTEIAAESGVLGDPRWRHGVWLRLLEDGDAADLAPAFAKWGEVEAAETLRRRAARGLSRRSRAFWSVVLDAGPQPSDHAAREGGANDVDAALRQALWPLA